MKKMSLILLCALAGCGQAAETKSVAQLESEIAQRQEEIARVKRAGNYASWTPETIVCTNGVLYYYGTRGYYSFYAPVVDSRTLQFKRCAEE